MVLRWEIGKDVVVVASDLPYLYFLLLFCLAYSISVFFARGLDMHSRLCFTYLFCASYFFSFPYSLGRFLIYPLVIQVVSFYIFYARGMQWVPLSIPGHILVSSPNAL